MQNTQKYIQDSKDKFLNELIDLLKIPTVSADSAYAKEVIRGAEKVAEQVNAIQDAAINNQNLFERLMEATKYCSLGQITAALFEVGGQYRRNM
mgnify:CR=1 FL=1